MWQYYVYKQNINIACSLGIYYKVNQPTNQPNHQYNQKLIPTNTV
jgi:hypothetical protein